MWKWTDPKNIKVVILDTDSLDKDYLLFPYNQYLPNVQLFFVKHIDTPNYYEQEVITYFDITVMLQEILLKSKCNSTSIISISNNPIFLKEMMQNHIGTVLTGDLKKDFLKFTPDFTDCIIDLLPSVLQNGTVGYGAEVYATYGEARIKMSLLKCKSEISLNDGTIREVDFFFGGRYYSDRHQYLFNDPLSHVILNFKHQYTKAVDLFFDSAIYFIRRREPVDILTYIPLKPNDIATNRFDRFANLRLERNSKDQIKLQNVLICHKDFSQKGNDLFMRKETVKDAFSVALDVQGKNIIIIDDVYSTGSTIAEAIRTLYGNGANKVTAILLAVNQMTESFLEYQNLTCPICGNEMTLRMNNHNGKLFFGCKGYKQHPETSYTIDVEKGLSLLKDKNKLVVSDIIDLEDEY